MFSARYEAQEEAKASMIMAQEHAKWYFDLNHRKVPFKVGDKVMIKGKDIHFHVKRPLSDKLVAKQHGPFVITHQYGEATFRLNLTYRYKDRHPVFHVQKLIPYKTDQIGNREPERPPPLDIEDDEDSTDPIYEIEKIVDSSIVKDKQGNKHVRFTVRWKGYTDEEDQYKSLWQLRGAKDLIRDYIKAHPDADLPKSLTNDNPRPKVTVRRSTWNKN